MMRRFCGQAFNFKFESYCKLNSNLKWKLNQNNTFLSNFDGIFNLKKSFIEKRNFSNEKLEDVRKNSDENESLNLPNDPEYYNSTQDENKKNLESIGSSLSQEPSTTNSIFNPKKNKRQTKIFRYPQNLREVSDTNSINGIQLYHKRRTLKKLLRRETRTANGRFTRYKKTSVERNILEKRLQRSKQEYYKYKKKMKEDELTRRSQRSTTLRNLVEEQKIEREKTREREKGFVHKINWDASINKLNNQIAAKIDEMARMKREFNVKNEERINQLKARLGISQKKFLKKIPRSRYFVINDRKYRR